MAHPKDKPTRKQIAKEAYELQAGGVLPDDAAYTVSQNHGIRFESVVRYMQEYPKESLASDIRRIDNGAIISHKKKTVLTPEQAWRKAKEGNQDRIDDERHIHFVTIKIKEELPIGFAWITDEHLDDPRADLQRAEEDAKTVAKTEGLYCGSGGDELNHYIKQLERYPNFDDPTIPVRERFQLFRHWLSIVDAKLWFMLAGNHEFFAYGRGGFLYQRELAENKQIHYAKDFVAPLIKLGKQVYTSYFTHTYWGKSRLNPIHELLRLARHAIPDVRPDLIGTGHLHNIVAMTASLDGKIIVALKGGSYKMNAADYEEQARYPKAIPQMPMAILFPDRHEILPVPSIPLGAQILTDLRKRYKQKRKSK